jgi:conjugative transfer signal peptidase TraF
MAPMCRSSHSRASVVVGIVLAAFALGFPNIWKPLPHLVYNRSASAPLGFYRLTSDVSFGRGDLVFARLPEPAAQLAASRRYLPLSVPVVKRIAALDGDLVCAQSGIVSINNSFAARTLPHDSEGRPLLASHGCRPLASGEVFLLMTDAPASFDSRYFGPIQTTAIIGRLVPLWTW